jgi:hypothetical protein
MSIESRVPRVEYDAINAMSVTRLKELRRSAQHYQYALANPKKSDAMTLGIATHVAVLEPERFERDFAIWERRTDAGASAPRRGQYWDDFQMLHLGKTVLTRDEGLLSKQIARAVRGSPIAMRYLESGDPEVTMRWDRNERACKGRADWLVHMDGTPTIVGFKTARDCRHFQFGAQCAKLGYHLQFAFYHDGYHASTGVRPNLIEIVAESEPPHAVAVYRIPRDVIEQGREEYERLLEQLAHCERTKEWPGPQPVEEDLSLPTWAYAPADDLADLELESE